MKKKEVRRLMDEYARIPRTGADDLARFEAFRASAPAVAEKPVKRTINRRILVGALACAFVFAIAVPLLVTYLLSGGIAMKSASYDNASSGSVNPSAEKNYAPDSAISWEDEKQTEDVDPYVRIAPAQASMLQDEALSAQLGRTVLRIRYQDEDVGYAFSVGEEENVVAGTLYVYTSDIRLYTRRFETGLSRLEGEGSIRYSETHGNAGYTYDILFADGWKQYYAHVETADRIDVRETVRALSGADNG